MSRSATSRDPSTNGPQTPHRRMPPQLWPVLREILASVRAQRVPSLVTALLVLGATATVLATAGRNAGVEAAVLSRIDDIGTRSLSVYVQGNQPGFTPDVVRALASYDVIESVTGFGTVTDVTASANPAGTPVGMRTAYGRLGSTTLTVLAPVAGHRQAWATPAAAQVLGLTGGRGVVRMVDPLASGGSGGQEVFVTGSVELPAHLASIDPAVVVPGSLDSGEPLSSLVVVADTPQDLAMVTRLVQAHLGDIPRDKVRVESSQSLADVRRIVGGELTAQSRGIVVGVMTAAAAAALVVVWSMALMRRRDFGRRRALGATRMTIVALIVGQTFVISAAAALLGALAGVSWLAVGAQPIPTAPYIAAVVVGFALVTTLASALPAAWAARRDPLAELRVP